MRNIAFLEWGPVLRYVAPRDQILIRGWYSDGPTLPKFLSNGGTVTKVRYALCAFENLDKVIGNLRRCFGFRYNESIGFWNALRRKGRVRRENEHILEKLSVWSIATNMDAVVWIDYAKTTAIKGGLGFNLRSFSPKPFCKAQFRMLGDSPTRSPLSPDSEDGGGGQEAEVEHESAGRRGRGVFFAMEKDILAKIMDLKSSEGRTSAVGLERYAPSKKNAVPKLPLKPAEKKQEELVKPWRKYAASPENRKKLSVVGKPGALLKEEVPPVLGSIYARSIAPGPGYYEGRRCLSARSTSFGYKPMTQMDSMVKSAREAPGPGQYDTPLSTLGSVGIIFPTTKKTGETDPLSLPFISNAHLVDLHGIHGPGKIYDVAESTLSTTRYSFPKSRKV